MSDLSQGVAAAAHDVLARRRVMRGEIATSPRAPSVTDLVNLARLDAQAAMYLYATDGPCARPRELAESAAAQLLIAIEMIDAEAAGGAVQS